VLAVKPSAEINPGGFRSIPRSDNDSSAVSARIKGVVEGIGLTAELKHEISACGLVFRWVKSRCRVNVQEISDLLCLARGDGMRGSGRPCPTAAALVRVDG